MTKWRDIAKLLDSCYSLFLREIGEPQENVLRLCLLEAKRSGEAESLQVGGTVIENLHRLQVTSHSRVFELVWNQYIAYAVTNELFGRRMVTKRLIRAVCCAATPNRHSSITLNVRPWRQGSIPARTPICVFCRRTTSLMWFPLGCQP